MQCYNEGNVDQVLPSLLPGKVEQMPLALAPGGRGGPHCIDTPLSNKPYIEPYIQPPSSRLPCHHSPARLPPAPQNHALHNPTRAPTCFTCDPAAPPLATCSTPCPPQRQQVPNVVQVERSCSCSYSCSCTTRTRSAP